MTRLSETPQQGAAEERLLREMYDERAPEHIETDRAWAAVAPRLALQAASARQQRGLRLWPIDPGMQRIADEGLYQDVKQSQTVDGVTVTITAAYADEERTVLYYRVQLSPELARQHQSASLGAWDLTADQAEQATHAPDVAGGVGVCAPWDSATRSASCCLVQGPFAPGATASHLALTLDISRVYLITPGTGLPEIDGHWRYQFTIPFHHINIGSVEQFFPHLLHLAPTQPQP